MVDRHKDKRIEKKMHGCACFQLTYDMLESYYSIHINHENDFGNGGVSCGYSQTIISDMRYVGFNSIEGYEQSTGCQPGYGSAH